MGRCRRRRSTRVLARPNLTYADRIEALRPQGLRPASSSTAYDDADAALDAAVAEWRTAPHIDDPYYIAMANYYRGELAHRRFLEAPVRLPDDQMVADLEPSACSRSQAYDRWKESLGFKQAYWATAAGYQMSQIFVELWEATVKAPYPERIDAATRPTVRRRGPRPRPRAPREGARGPPDERRARQGVRRRHDVEPGQRAAAPREIMELSSPTRPPGATSRLDAASPHSFMTSSPMRHPRRGLPAGVAQPVEHLTCNQEVAGSSPTASSSQIDHTISRRDARAAKGSRL